MKVNRGCDLGTMQSVTRSLMYTKSPFNRFQVFPQEKVFFSWTLKSRKWELSPSFIITPKQWISCNLFLNPLSCIWHTRMRKGKPFGLWVFGGHQILHSLPFFCIVAGFYSLFQPRCPSLNWLPLLLNAVATTEHSPGGGVWPTKWRCIACCN